MLNQLVVKLEPRNRTIETEGIINNLIVGFLMHSASVSTCKFRFDAMASEGVVSRPSGAPVVAGTATFRPAPSRAWSSIDRALMRSTSRGIGLAVATGLCPTAVLIARS